MKVGLSPLRSLILVKLLTADFLSFTLLAIRLFTQWVRAVYLMRNLKGSKNSNSIAAKVLLNPIWPTITVRVVSG